MSIKTELVVLGGGPGGYTAAFRAADLGKQVVLVEKHENIGGVCLNVGCIPSKALLHVAKVIDESQDIAAHGVQFGKPVLDIQKIAAWKNNLIAKLTGGLKMLAKQRKVQIVRGTAQFTSANELEVTQLDGTKEVIQFDNAIIAVGSKPVNLPFIPQDPRIIDSTGALKLEKTDGHLLILGGGIIGLEMATVYHALGCQISIVEMQDQLIPGADPDIVKPLHKRLEKRYKAIHLSTKVTKVEAKKDAIYVTFEGKEPQAFDQILVCCLQLVCCINQC